MLLTTGVGMQFATRHRCAVGSRRAVPHALLRGPITLDEARRHGLDLWHLQGRNWRRVGPATYLHATVVETLRLRIDAASRRLPSGAAFSGMTAAWLHGLKVDELQAIEVTMPNELRVSARAGMKVRRCELPSTDVVRIGHVPATSVLRTLRDLCLGASLVEAVVLVDMALHARLVTLDALRRAVDEWTGKQGVHTLRRALEHAEPKAESPMETRLRMLLVLAGLPRPEAQVSIRDRFFKLRGRLDLYYRDESLGLEYDGAIHKDSVTADNRRQNRLVDGGIRLLRFTAADIYGTPDDVVRQVRKALAR